MTICEIFPIIKHLPAVRQWGEENLNYIKHFSSNPKARRERAVSAAYFLSDPRVRFQAGYTRRCRPQGDGVDANTLSCRQESSATLFTCA